MTLSKKVTSSKNSKKIKKTVTTPNSLLLAYTYFLNNQQTCKVIFGFDVNTYQAVIIFQRNNFAPLMLNFDEWTHFFNIQKEETSTDEIHNNREALVEPLHNLEFSSVKTFTLKQNEYEIMEKMINFINAVMIYNCNAQGTVKEYIESYIAKCIERNIHELPYEDCYIPMQISFIHCNYSRLFYEIPIFLKNKILEKLTNV
jgi:hypothetical protein